MTATRIIATDSEWDNGQWISTAFASENDVTVFIRDDVPAAVRSRLETTATTLAVKLIFIERNDNTNFLKQISNEPCRLALYFSPKDIEYAVGWEDFKAAIDANTVRQRNNLAGKIGKVMVKDLFGWSGRRKLETLASSLGVPMLNKSGMDPYKACMFTGLVERPDDFLQYAVDDAQVLLKVYQSFIGLFTTIQKDCLGMKDDDLWTVADIPMTCGALVAKTFERWLYGGDDADVLKFCVRKLGILDPDDRRYRHSQWAYLTAVDRFTTIEAVKHGRDEIDLREMMKARFVYTGLDGCGIRWWADRPMTDSACFNALVQGGRCLNENPYEYQLGPGLDVDISGCYGESLRSLVYPVGLPTCWSYSANEKRPTLGEWLDENEADLLPGLWCAVVSGKLPFEQDLIFSKLVKARDIRKVVWTADQEDSDIPSDFVMLRQEIKNGIITGDVLTALQKVATNIEWRAIRSLELVTAVAYRQQDRKEDMRAWCEAVLADQGKYKVKADTRTRAWFGIPLENFVGRLADRRKIYKAQGKDSQLPEEERTRAAGLDAMLKLLVNTVYGVFASRYFTIGNTVLANNITARARVGVWMVAKALGLRQSITDGGIYTPNAVPAFRNKKPGLDVLSRPWDWMDKRNGRRSYISLGDGPDIDRLAMDHVRRFWKPYGLTFPFKLEHKTDNTFSRAAYWSKADYALQTSKGVVYAVRGKDKNKRSDRKQHPSFALLDNLLSGSDSFPDDLSYTKGGIMKIGKYRVVQDSNGYAELKGLRPGDNLPDVEYVARYNNTYFPLTDEADFLARKNRKKVHRGEPVEWFERHRPEISAVHRHMTQDKLR